MSHCSRKATEIDPVALECPQLAQTAKLWVDGVSACHTALGQLPPSPLTCCSRGAPRDSRRLKSWSPVPARCTTKALRSRSWQGCSSCTLAVRLGTGSASYTLPQEGDTHLVCQLSRGLRGKLQPHCKAVPGEHGSGNFKPGWRPAHAG